jgi:hypothetical protein
MDTQSQTEPVADGFLRRLFLDSFTEDQDWIAVT